MMGDRYAEYYAAKLWHLIPAVYRSLDSDPTAPGPLREIVDRVAAQAAVLRRSIDRLWEDQSIETCDDWIIPYIGDLVATQLVACLDPAGQRRDVAKTIYYRRRKGTVGLLEELASDIASRDARIVEFFRHLGRTRHNFDPPIALPPLAGAGSGPPPMVVEGLIGASTGTPMGGYADLRNVYGASRTSSAFDEYFYTADFRRGRQSVGWYNIPKVGAFVWWLKTYAVPASTPVPYTACLPKLVFTFDPTGREVPLFAPMQRTSDAFGENWISADEWQLPVPIDQLLFDRAPGQLYPAALAVLEGNTPPYLLVPLPDPDNPPPISATIRPEPGRFYLNGVAPSGGQVHVRYHYGFGSEIGAGPYDQRRGGTPLPRQPDQVKEVSGGGPDLANKAAALGTQGTLLIRDSLTYALPGDLGGVSNVLVQGDNEQRPVIRAVAAARPQWTITGAPGAKLILQGIHLVGADLVLSGKFDSVTIRCTTLDPGTSGAMLQPPALFATAADGQTLWPTRLFVEARIAALDISQSITGPIRTRNGGGIEVLTITDSIVQSLPESPDGLLTVGDLYDADLLAVRFAKAADPLSQFIAGKLPMAGTDVTNHEAGSPPSDALLQELVADLNVILAAPLYDPARFAQVSLPPDLLAQAQLPHTGAELIALNRRLLAQAYPTAFASLAIATFSGETRLTRTTVLGPLAVHRLDASECILDDVALAEDAQHGCIRFSAYATGSVAHQPYESVTVAPAAPLFRDRTFGRPHYARLRENVDADIVTGREGASIMAGAENGSEMGAFCREKIPLKRRGLTQKFAEYMPIGQVPVWIDAT